MKLVNVDDVLKILHKYGEYIFVTDEKRYWDMTDEIANLKTPLPKGHGDLIDRNVAREAMMFEMSGTGYQSRAMNVIDIEFYTPTIIEADEEGKE